MTRLVVVVEGQTEEEFCNEVLFPWLRERVEGLRSAATKLDPSRDEAGRSRRGGHAHPRRRSV